MGGERAESGQSASWLGWFEQQRLSVDAALSAHLNWMKGGPQSAGRLGEAVEYVLTRPAKRVRPILVLESCRVCGGEAEAAWPAAIAIECVHAFSLIHDDLPAMDDDDLRRGHPTCHKVFGEATAILAGDWLLAHALRLLAGERPAQRGAALAARLGDGAAAMIVGQAADLEGEKLAPEASLVEAIHRDKTARLIETACRMGAVCAGADAEREERLGAFGLHLGLAFQIVDDLLDRTGTQQQTGKRVGKDAGESKQTFPGVFGEAESRRRAAAEIDTALSHLVPFGDCADRLRGLARFVLERDR